MFLYCHMLHFDSSYFPPESELEFSYARSSGPGGQNVNKVNSKAVLKWNVAESPSLTEEMRAFLSLKVANDLNKEGEWVIASDAYRDQIRNRQECLDKLRAHLKRTLTPVKKRKKTKPTKGSVRRRESGKKKQGEKKSLRKRPLME